MRTPWVPSPRPAAGRGRRPARCPAPLQSSRGVGSAASVPAAAGLGCWCCLSGYVLPPGDRVGSDKGGALLPLSPSGYSATCDCGGEFLEVLTLRKVSGGVCEITIGLRGCQTSGARNRAGPSLLLAAGELKAGLSARPVAASGRGRFLQSLVVFLNGRFLPIKWRSVRGL